MNAKKLARDYVAAWIEENANPPQTMENTPNAIPIEDIGTQGFIQYRNEVYREASENCIHFTQCDNRKGGCCSIRGNKKVKHRFCHDACNDRAYRSRGFGDTVKKIIKKITRGKLTPKSKGCGCNKRRKKLNDLISYN